MRQQRNRTVILRKVNVVSLHLNVSLDLGYRYPGTESANFTDSGGIYVHKFIIRKTLQEAQKRLRHYK